MPTGVERPEQANGVKVVATVLVGEFEDIHLTILQLGDHKIGCDLCRFEVCVKFPAAPSSRIVVRNGVADVPRFVSR